MSLSKGGVLDHYIPHMIISHSNWYYNKHHQVKFGAYVQASQVNDPKNTKFPRTLDEIYSCPAPNFQGGYHIMELWMGQLITSQKVFKIPITYVLISTVIEMAKDQGFKSLKFYNEKKEGNYFPWC